MKKIPAGTIVCMGDSNTWGYDPVSPFGSRYPAGVCWTDRLAAAGYTVFPDAANGRMIPGGKALEEAVRTARAALPAGAVVLLLGTNDLLNGRSAPEAASSLERLCNALGEALPPGRICLTAPPMGRGSWTDSALIQENRSLAALCRDLAARQGFAFADASALQDCLCFDGVHLTPEGHLRLARLLAPVLAEMLAV